LWSAQALAHVAGCSEVLVQAPSKAVVAPARGWIRRHRARAGAAEAALRSKAAAQANVSRPSRRRSRAVVLEPSMTDQKCLRPGDKVTTVWAPRSAAAVFCPVRVQRERVDHQREMEQHFGRGVRHALALGVARPVANAIFSFSISKTSKLSHNGNACSSLTIHCRTTPSLGRDSSALRTGIPHATAQRTRRRNATTQQQQSTRTYALNASSM